MATSVGRWNGSPLMYPVDTPGVPSVKITLPSGVHLRTVWSSSSTRNSVPSGANVIPCERGYMAGSPQSLKYLPFVSKTMTGWSPRLKT